MCTCSWWADAPEDNTNIGRSGMQVHHQDHDEIPDSQGAVLASGTEQTQRLLAARLRPALTDTHLVPRSRGAFSNLDAIPLDGRAIAPNEVGL